MSTELGPLIVTHSGSYHADDLTAVAIILIENPGARIYRDTDYLDQIRIADYVVDCGQEYNRNLRRFDHHQKGFSKMHNSEDSPLMASAGLVWDFMGDTVVSRVIKTQLRNKDIPFDFTDERVERDLLDCANDRQVLTSIAEQVNEKFIIPIDMWDYGKYPIGRNCSLSAVIASMSDVGVPFEKAKDFLDTSLRATIWSVAIRTIRGNLISNSKYTSYETDDHGGSILISDVINISSIMWAEKQVNRPLSAVISPSLLESRRDQYVLQIKGFHLKHHKSMRHLSKSKTQATFDTVEAALSCLQHQSPHYVRTIT